MCCMVLFYQQRPPKEGSGQTCTDASSTLACLIISSVFREKSCLLRVMFFLTWTIFWKGRNGWMNLLFYLAFLYFLLNSNSCQLKRWNLFAVIYIFFSEFLYLPGSYDTTNSCIPQNLCSCSLFNSFPKYIDLTPVLLQVTIGIS